MSEPPIRVLVADDQGLVREGLMTLLGTSPQVEPVGAARDGAEAVRMCGELEPAVVLMDLRMPGVDGVEATRRIRAEHPATEVVVLTTHADDESILSALAAGARGYLTKDAGLAEIVRAVQAAAAGQALLDPSVQARLLAAAARSPSVGGAGGAGGVPGVGGDGGPRGAVRAADSAPSPRPALAPADDLTPRELEVLALIAGGLSNAEIAQTLFVSDATVKTHINHVFSKIGARDRAQAVHYAYTHGVAG